MLPLDFMTALLASRTPAAVGWLPLSALNDSANGDDLERLCTQRLADVGRLFGKSRLVLTAEEKAAETCMGNGFRLDAWSTDELARAVLFLHAASFGAEAEMGATFQAWIELCFARGDNRERQSVLRSLALLPDPARFTPVAVDACRTNVEPIFQAIACDNPFPAAHFADLNFNQMVIKAVFIGLPLANVVGLHDRKTPELRRMAEYLASERRAAGRPIPSDLSLLT